MVVKNKLYHEELELTRANGRHVAMNAIDIESSLATEELFALKMK